MVKHCRGCFDTCTTGALGLKGVKCSIQSHGAQTESDCKPFPTWYVSPAVPRKPHCLNKLTNRDWMITSLDICNDVHCYWQSMHAREAALPWKRGTGSRMKPHNPRGKGQWPATPLRHTQVHGLGRIHAKALRKLPEVITEPLPITPQQEKFLHQKGCQEQEEAAQGRDWVTIPGGV